MTVEHDMTDAEQLASWVAGRPLHRRVAGRRGGECCPDFSCCRPHLLATEGERLAYQAGDQQVRDRFHVHFLLRLVENPEPESKSNVRVYVVGRRPGGDS